MKTKQQVSRFRPGVTLVEVLVVVGIVAILVAMTFAGVQSIRVSAARTQCINNLHQIGMGLLRYVDQHATVPSATAMETAIAPFVQSVQSINVCPVVVNSRSYGYNTCAQRLEPATDSGRIVAMDAKCLAVSFAGADSATWAKRIDARHRSLLNVLFLGGHVQTLVPGDIDPYDPVSGDTNVAGWWRPTPGCTTSGYDDCSGCLDCCFGGSGNNTFTGYYYDTYDWTGYAFTRPDNTLYLPFGGAYFFGVPHSSPNPNRAQPISYKGVGKLYVDTTDVYTFHMAIDDYGWFTLNNVPIFNGTYGGTRGWTYWWASSPMELKAGECYDFEVRQTNTGNGPSHVAIQWSTASNPTPRPIPATSFR